MTPCSRLSTLALYLALAQAQLHLPFSRQVQNLGALPLWRSEYAFLVNATVGNQDVALVINPSIADTWVPANNSWFCGDTERPNYCFWGSYDQPATSETENGTFDSYTPDSTMLYGRYFNDTLKVGGATVEHLQMGLSTDSSQLIGMLGLGLNYTYYDGRYDNFPDRLVAAGTIPTKAYSIWLDAEDGSAGSLLMGAIDTSRYEGTLTRMSAYAAYPILFPTFGVTVTGVNASGRPIAAPQLPFRASFGPGETFSYLPEAIAENIWSATGAAYNRTIRMATIRCDAATAGAAPDMRFAVQLAGAGGPVLSFGLADLIVPQSVSPVKWAARTSDPTGAPPGTCLFAVQNGTKWQNEDTSGNSLEDNYNIGGALLRTTYMVFDLLNRELALAPVKSGDTGPSKVVPFASYGAAVPSATVFCPAGNSTCASAASTLWPDRWTGMLLVVIYSLQMVI